MNTMNMNEENHFQQKYNDETELAIEEARNIISGKIKTKSYESLDELLDEINREDN